MQFMLHIDVTLPTGLPQNQLDDLRQRENAQSKQFITDGTMKRIWRTVGRVASYSLWEVATLEELHASVQKLPMFPYMKIVVTPLIVHPVTESYLADKGSLPPL